MSGEFLKNFWRNSVEILENFWKCWRISVECLEISQGLNGSKWTDSGARNKTLPGRPWKVYDWGDATIHPPFFNMFEGYVKSITYRVYIYISYKYMIYIYIPYIMCVYIV